MIVGRCRVDRSNFDRPHRLDFDVFSELEAVLLPGGFVLIVPGREQIRADPPFRLVDVADEPMIAVDIYVAVGVAAVMQKQLSRNAGAWDSGVAVSPAMKTLAVVSMMLWLTAIVAGRLIAYL